MDSGHLCSAMIQLHATAQSGGEFSAGLSHGGVSSAHTAVWAHGIIMIIGWLVLLPAGGVLCFIMIVCKGGEEIIDHYSAIRP